MLHMFKKEIRQWGWFKTLIKTKRFWIKEIFVEARKKTSLQSHFHRTEYWFFLDDRSFQKVAKEEKHRITGGRKGRRLIEIAIGLPEEEDIIRYQDDYGRAGKSLEK